MCCVVPQAVMCRAGVSHFLPLMTRTLLFGAPTDNSIANALSHAAQDIAESLTCHSKSPSAGAGTAAAAAASLDDDSTGMSARARGSLQMLLKLLLSGLAGLTHAELHSVAGQLLRLAGQTAEDAEAQKLSAQLRCVMHA